MANREHIRRLEQGVKAWNAWRLENPDIEPDLVRATREGADLHAANLRGADLRSATLVNATMRRADLSGADLRGANLSYVQLSTADLIETNLSGANLLSADLQGAILSRADLSYANLNGAILSASDLGGADLRRTDLRDTILRSMQLSSTNLAVASLNNTVFVDVDLSTTLGLDTCVHYGPSSVDHRTLQKSGPLPLTFLRGVGFPDMLIDYLPSLLNQAIQHYSCFISYSTKDQDFADRLYADLQGKGVRCWFAPDDLSIGGKILDEIDAAIRLRDKLLLILSEHSIKSDWVEDEVTKAFEEERKRGQTMLFPVRLDDAVMDTNEAWAVKLRNQRHIGDFTRWKDHDAYKKSFERVLRDLKVRKTDGKP